ncbi:MAG: glycosyltransferase, partial [Solirubrobacteraceae bacterium]|nr:glycosyltransferase [Solirubrobacteraceae bacterium]
PVALDPAQADAGVEQAVGALHDAAAVDGRRPVAITYAADPGKKGLTRTVAAFARVRHPEEVLLVAGLEALPPTIAGTEGVVAVGRLERPVFRALVRSVGTFVIAPRREDYGLVQLEALAEGARVVTTEAPGPYAALPVIRQLWPEQVVGADASDGELGRAIRSALDARPDPAEQLRATAAVEPWAPEQVRQILRERVIPQMLDGRPPS